MRALGPAHLVAEFDARKGHDAGLAQDYGELARALGADLVLEVVLPCVDVDGRPTDDLDVLRRDLNYVKGQIERVAVRPARIAVSPACDLKCTLPGSVWPKAPAWAELVAAARAAFPGVPIGGGMFSYFTELNRKRPPAGLFDFVGHTICPLVHAGDDLSLTEGLEALPYIIKTTRAFAGDTPYWLFPSAIAMRQNPYGAAPAENPHLAASPWPATDPRERALIGAAWYAGVLAHAARGGLEAVTLAAVAGPSGVVAPDGSRRPVFEVLRGHAALRGQPVRASRSSAPREVQVTAVGDASLAGQPDRPGAPGPGRGSGRRGRARPLCGDAARRLARSCAGRSGLLRPAGIPRDAAGGDDRVVDTPGESRAMSGRPPFPPFTRETAIQKVRMAEDAWNTRDPERVALAYTADTQWRNRAEFPQGRDAGRPVPAAEMGARARLPADQGAVGVHRGPDRRALRLRVARRCRQLVPLLRQRELGVRRRGPDAAALSPASTTCRSARPTASITGRRVRDRPITPDCRTSACRLPGRPTLRRGPVRQRHVRFRVEQTGATP